MDKNSDDLVYVCYTMFAYSWKIRKKNRFPKSNFEVKKLVTNLNQDKNVKLYTKASTRNSSYRLFSIYGATTRNIERLEVHSLKCTVVAHGFSCVW
jgi:hypothetical protein